LFFDVLDTGVAGPEYRGSEGSDIWRSRCERPKRSPKLFLLVDVDVRADAKVGVGSGSSLGTFLKEFKVDDRPRRPTLECRGDELLEAVEPCLNSGVGVGGFEGELRDGEARGDRNSCDSRFSFRKACTAGDSAPRVRAAVLIGGMGGTGGASE
jgi:hypothetical protein